MNIIDPLAKILGTWSSDLCLGSILFRLGISLVFAAIIGCE